MNLDITNIRSKTALIETAKALRALADSFDIQAQILEERRNYIGIGEHDTSALARALNYVKIHPKFPQLTVSECRKICDRFALDYLPNCEALMRAQRKKREGWLKKRNQAMRKMKMNGKKNKEIARRFDLSEARTCEILRPRSLK